VCARSYAIRVKGDLGPTTLNALPELRGEPLGADTVLTGELADRSAFYGLVARLEALGLDLLEVRRVAASDDDARLRQD
jgi:hypothetical protein